MLICRSENGGPVLARHGVDMTAGRNGGLEYYWRQRKRRLRSLKWSSTDEPAIVKKFVLLQIIPLPRSISRTGARSNAVPVFRLGSPTTLQHTIGNL
jgi:hypothetical protein